MSDTAERIRAAIQAVTGLPDALAQPMRQLGQADRSGTSKKPTTIRAGKREP